MGRFFLGGRWKEKNVWRSGRDDGAPIGTPAAALPGRVAAVPPGGVDRRHRLDADAADAADAGGAASPASRRRRNRRSAPPGGRRRRHGAFPAEPPTGTDHLAMVWPYHRRLLFSFVPQMKVSSV